uniref:Beta-defensin-like domain-containing protein n=1 Tax=Terrapene triunguis TaxID=2587831 RepID=A0A674JYS2_9SAUR
MVYSRIIGLIFPGLREWEIHLMKHAFSDRDIRGTARCLARGGGCYLFRCPPRTVLSGRCTRYNPCCRPQVRSGFYKGNITV